MAGGADRGGAGRAAARRTVVIVSTVRSTHEAFLRPQAAALAEEGHRVIGVSNGLPASPAADVYDATYDIPLSRQPSPGDAARAGATIRRILIDEKADLVWFHTPLASSVGRMAAATIPRKRRPLVVYMAHGFHFGSVRPGASGFVYRELERVLSKVTDHLQTVNREDYEGARRLLGRTASNTELTRGVGIDVDRFAGAGERRAEVRADLGIAEDDRAIFVVGDLNPEKRVGDAIAAVGRLGAPHRLFVAGQGPLRDQLETEAADLPDGAVTFLGFRDDVRDLLGAADALVHPSSREGLPTVVLEAQAAGVPVVGARARGTADLLAGGAGLLCPVGRPERLADELRRLFTDDALRAEVVRAGTQRASHHRVELATGAALSVSLCLSTRRRDARSPVGVTAS